MTDTINSTLSCLAHQFVVRASAQGWKGKTRDKHCIEFFIGASAALEAVNHPDAPCILMTTTLLICTRGYSEVEAMCKRTPAAPEPTNMNQLENASLMARHKPSGQWRMALLSGIPGHRIAGVFRVDAGEGEELCDFELWAGMLEVTSDGSKRFHPQVLIQNVTALYS